MLSHMVLGTKDRNCRILSAHLALERQEVPLEISPCMSGIPSIMVACLTFPGGEKKS
jgi:hypothetical protein